MLERVSGHCSRLVKWVDDEIEASLFSLDSFSLAAGSIPALAIALPMSLLPRPWDIVGITIGGLMFVGWVLFWLTRAVRSIRLKAAQAKLEKKDADQS